ncbi:Alkaline phosphatase precursor (plasmid) [Tsukamurella tyrosinosolvens]|uniref:Alkaline phosphatase n=2 Tax=Tsukamurella TaxID=2060 RepID=A0A1H1BD34_9ACTN|nr:alkaline phosphatase [Tsukamurella pulmonis]SED55584.1 alkaline phosphatase [Tsukamurella tyrosinosolvens]SUP25321.1 Alkaline phosphatase precursor [Tsukamurella pulmonis]VEI01701.1 Alkaline phosphatase precursor [Tsukamurella tyrosinosolvens]
MDITRSAAGDITAHGGAKRLAGDQTQAIADSIQRSKAKNVILIIGDGTANQELTLARDYQWGAGGQIPGIDQLPLSGDYTTYALDKNTKKPDYTTDSAASGSAWATGTKTYNGAVGVDVNGKAQRSILEIAKANGRKTGNVTTTELQDATPAVQVAHVAQRKCYGPVATKEKCASDALENGGLGSITEQLLAARADVTLGGGFKTFQEVAGAGQYAGKTLEVQAKERGYQMVRSGEELDAVKDAGQDKPLLGVFADGNLPRLWGKATATKEGGKEPAVTCSPNPEFAATPKLETMTKKAIDLLGGDKGFFLQVESGSVDKANHDADPCGQIGETVQLSEAVTAALDFAKKDKDTLVIVTGDHAHTSQIVETGSVTPGLTRTLNTKDGGLLTVNYGTSLDPGEEQHTGGQVRIAAYGPGAANVVGVTDQTDPFFYITDVLGLDRAKK